MVIDLHPDAYALQAVRVIADRFRYYEAVTFPDNPWSGCELWLRRLDATGGLRDDGSQIALDVLNANDDVIQDFSLTKHGFEYLRRSLRFRRVE